MDDHASRMSKTILDSIPAGISVYHSDKDIKHVVPVAENRYLVELLNLPEEDLYARRDDNIFELVHPDERELVKNSWRELTHHPEIKENITLYRVINKGEWKWYQAVVSAVKQPDGNYYIYNVYTDAREQKRQEKEYNDTMQNLLIANPNARCSYKLNLTKNICTDFHGASEFVEKLIDAETVDELFGKVEKVIIDKEMVDWFRENVSREKLIEKYENGEKQLNLIYRRLTEKGAPLWVKTFYHLIKNPETKDIEAVAYTLDIDQDYKEDKILTRIADKYYDSFGLIDAATGEIQYYYGHDELDNFDREKVIDKLDKYGSYTYSKTVRARKKQINFTYLDDLCHQIVFAQLDVTEEQQREDETARLRIKSERDALTGIYNREAGEEKTTEILEEETKGTLFIFDLDDFKHINDNYGHQVGDAVLRKFADFVDGQFRETDIVFRLGGDEFSVFAVDMLNKQEISKKAGSIVNHVKSIRVEEHPEIRIAISVGAAVNRKGGLSYQEMYRMADRQLYIAKQKGKDTYSIGT